MKFKGVNLCRLNSIQPRLSVKSDAIEDLIWAFWINAECGWTIVLASSYIKEESSLTIFTKTSMTFLKLTFRYQRKQTYCLDEA